MISNWALIYGREKGASVSLTMVLPSPILLGRCSSLLSSWVIQALAKAVGAAAVQPPHFIRNASAFASEMLFVSSALEALHTWSYPNHQSPWCVIAAAVSHIIPWFNDFGLNLGETTQGQDFAHRFPWLYLCERGKGTDPLWTSLSQRKLC